MTTAEALATRRHRRSITVRLALASLASVADQCVFCAIVAGTTDAHYVFRDTIATGFLDKRPLFPGHVLVVPNEHHETLPDLPELLIEPLFTRVRRVAEVLRHPFGAPGSFVAMNNVVSQSVPHLHVHVVPRTRGDGLRGFFWPRTGYDDDRHMAATAARLAAAYAAA